MTKQEFIDAPLHEQIAFLESGSEFSSTVSSSAVEKPETDGRLSNVVPAHTSVKDDSLPLSESPQASSPITEIDNYADGFDFKNPIEMLVLLDPDIRTGRVQLSKKQVQHLLDFAQGGQSEHRPHQSVVCWPNGSGKDKYIIAPEVVWLNMRYKRARGVVTSSSGVQLDNQTCTYIDLLCQAANSNWGNIWKCNYREYLCLPTESPVICYATDEAGKAEGFHPLEYGRKMGIYVSEDKTVPDDINIALNKCTGYTHRVHVSTPGVPLGHFYDLFQIAVDRLHISNISELTASDYLRYHATAYDFQHISKAYIEQMKRDLPGGEFGSAFKSQVLAQFGTTDEQVVLSYTHIWKSLRNPTQHIAEAYNKAGLDLADGGAENVLHVRNGNKSLKQIPFRFDREDDLVPFLEDRFEENHLTHPEAYIFGDAVGIGGPTLYRLKRRGWKNIRFFDSRAAAHNNKVFYRKGDEVWFDFAKRVERNEIILLDDQLLTKQLSSRYYKILEGKHKLLSKPEQKSKGFPSPDRGDACVYAYSDYTDTVVRESDDKVERPYEIPEEESKYSGDFTLKGHARGHAPCVTYNINNRFNVNGGNKDFRLLEEEISEYNRLVKQT